MNAGALLERVYRELHDEIVDGISTGGTVGTAVTDTAIIGKYPDNKFKNWVAFISSTTDGLAPQAEYAVITTNVNSTGVFTFPALTAATGAGDTYAVVKATIPVNTMLKLANDGLQGLGRIWVNGTAGTTASSTRNYALPLAAKGPDLREVYLLDTNNFKFPAPHYDLIQTVAGSVGTIQFREQPMASRTIYVNYLGIHPTLTAYSSGINETVPDELAIAAVVERALWWKAHPKRRKVDMENWGEAKRLLEVAKAEYRIKRPQHDNQRVPITMYN